MLSSQFALLSTLSLTLCISRVFSAPQSSDPASSLTPPSTVTSYKILAVKLEDYAERGPQEPPFHEILNVNVTGAWPGAAPVYCRVARNSTDMGPEQCATPAPLYCYDQAVAVSVLGCHMNNEWRWKLNVQLNQPGYGMATWEASSEIPRWSNESSTYAFDRWIKTYNLNVPEGGILIS